MKKTIIGLFLLGAVIAQAQEDSIKSLKPLKGSSGNDSITYFKTKIDDYKFWTNGRKPEVIDTTLHIKNYYNQNFIKQDAFGKLFYPNVGGVVVDLEYQNSPFNPSMLPTGKKYNYYYANEIKYYDVKSPYTEFIYENGVKEGNFLSSTFSHNINKQFNYTFHYRGLISEGRYKHEKAQNNTFVFSSNYKTKSERFKLWWNYAAQNLKNNENGGIKDIYDFILQDERRKTNIRNIDVNSQTAKSEFDARRIELNASYGILKKLNEKDSTFYNPIELKNKFSYEKQKYRYEDSSPNGDLYDTPLITGLDNRNKKSFTDLSNTTTAGFLWTDRVKIEAGVKLQSLRVFSEEPFIFSKVDEDDNIIYNVNNPKEIKENLFGVVGKVDFDWNEKLKLYGNVEYLQSDNYKSVYNVDAVLDITPIEGYTLSAGAVIQSKIPSLNAIYNQSFFADFNYANKFETENVQNLFAKLKLDKLNTTVEASLYNLDNKVYLDSDLVYKQLNDNINYFKIKGENHLRFGKINLVSTAQYQKVTKNENIMPLPDFLIRETLYWQGELFNKNAQLQAGINATYFTKYNGLRYIPILNEFAIQDPTNIQEIGGYPILDVFINFKVRNMRFYIRGEHINASFTKEPEYFAAPNVPYRDFKFQLGLKWNIFS
ncbi:putative porin [Empedobacter stercoris]|uniref:Porin n=1 Tax=Empedobacter stercoris TaxID=1628248 RepID=A0ABX1WN85_9FLAO|nr:putative porin [Empedobacter stercoris]MCA4810176.1 putative porin [Empedobacter stercoris]NOJ76077.1 putative porin [Empedobacter stercoris]QNT14970.1 putative porin [Empedobacter stercoris]